jgi:ABC-type transport system substrate-binding protein
MGIPEGLNEYPYDPDKAKQLLDSSGFDKSQKLEILHLPVASGGSKEKDAAVAIMQQQLKQVGFNIDIRNIDVNELNTRYVEKADFDIFYNGGGVFRADPSISGSYFLTRNFTPNGGNASHYSNPQVDDLYAQGQAAGDQAQRKQIYTEIAKILNDEVPWIYLWSPNSIYAASSRLQGFVAPSYVDNKLWNAETWSVTS